MLEPIVIKVNDIDAISERQQFVIDMERLYGTVQIIDDYGDIMVLSQLETADHGR